MKKQTKAVKKIKNKCQDLPKMKLLNKGHLIVYSDASKKYWGGILVEMNDGREEICMYVAGRFKKCRAKLSVRPKGNPWCKEVF